MATDSARKWNNPKPFTPPGRRKLQITGRQWDEINARLAEGETVQDIALAYGITAAYIKRRAANA